MSKDDFNLKATKATLEQVSNGVVLTLHRYPACIVDAGHVIPREAASHRVERLVFSNVASAAQYITEHLGQCIEDPMRKE